jgi:hypothetical protein
MREVASRFPASGTLWFGRAAARIEIRRQTATGGAEKIGRRLARFGGG